MIGQIVAHADPVITDWEIWNEPDNGVFFTGTPAQYAGMLRAAHDAIKGVDPQAQVALGGISGVAGQGWLAQVFATPGDDAAHAFEIANVHERSWLDQIGADIGSWRKFFAGYGFTGPLWVTEAGYPSDPGYQYDPSFTLGAQSQAMFLDASIPTMLSAGADEVFVTERDNLTGQFASEGLLGGDVADPPIADPQVVEKPSYAAVSALAQCYASLSRDCPQAAPAATPATALLGAARVGATSSATITVSDPGLEPEALGAATLSGLQPNPITLTQDSCSNRLLEPDQTCTLTAVFAPTAGGEATATLSLPSDNGTVAVPVSAASPAVADLTSLALLDPLFTPVSAADGTGHTQRLALTLVNPLTAPVAVRRAGLSGSHAFSLGADTCTTAPVASGASCQLTVLFRPVTAGTAHTRLTLSGDGAPLEVALHATAFALPSLRTGGGGTVHRARLQRPDPCRRQPAVDDHVAGGEGRDRGARLRERSLDRGPLAFCFWSCPDRPPSAPWHLRRNRQARARPQWAAPRDLRGHADAARRARQRPRADAACVRGALVGAGGLQDRPAPAERHDRQQRTRRGDREDRGGRRHRADRQKRADRADRQRRAPAADTQHRILGPQRPLRVVRVHRAQNRTVWQADWRCSGARSWLSCWPPPPSRPPCPRPRLRRLRASRSPRARAS